MPCAAGVYTPFSNPIRKSFSFLTNKTSLKEKISADANTQISCYRISNTVGPPCSELVSSFLDLFQNKYFHILSLLGLKVQPRTRSDADNRRRKTSSSIAEGNYNSECASLVVHTVHMYITVEEYNTDEV